MRHTNDIKHELENGANTLRILSEVMLDVRDILIQQNKLTTEPQKYIKKEEVVEVKKVKR